jgi:mercuric ion transport protein
MVRGLEWSEKGWLGMQSSLNAKLALAGGVLAGISASACCLGPLLLLSLGVGGAWIGHLTALEPYRPVFIVLTVLFLGLAFRKLYLVPQSCALEDNCVADRTRHVQRIVFWILLPLILGLVVSPWIFPILYR